MFFKCLLSTSIHICALHARPHLVFYVSVCAYLSVHSCVCTEGSEENKQCSFLPFSDFGLASLLASI